MNLEKLITDHRCLFVSRKWEINSRWSQTFPSFSDKIVLHTITLKKILYAHVLMALLKTYLVYRIALK